jgi:hypothetical protein
MELVCLAPALALLALISRVASIGRFPIVHL